MSGHHRQDRPNATQAMAAATPVPELFSQSPIGAPREPSTATPSNAEYVDIDLLREFCRVGAGFEDRNRLQIVGVSLQLALEHVPDGMMVMGVVARHRLEIGERR